MDKRTFYIPKVPLDTLRKVPKQKLTQEQEEELNSVSEDVEFIIKKIACDKLNRGLIDL